MNHGGVEFRRTRIKRSLFLIFHINKQKNMNNHIYQNVNTLDSTLSLTNLINSEPMETEKQSNQSTNIQAQQNQNIMKISEPKSSHEPIRLFTFQQTGQIHVQIVPTASILSELESTNQIIKQDLQQNYEYRYNNCPSFTMKIMSETSFHEIKYEVKPVNVKVQSQSIKQSKKANQTLMMVEGMIFKKAQFLNNWHERFIRLADNHIFTYETQHEFKNFNCKFAISLIQLGKMKLLSSSFNGKLIFRLYSNKTTEFAAEQSLCEGLPVVYAWFATILTSKLQIMQIHKPVNQTQQHEYMTKMYASGWVLKKSQFLGKWDKRFAILNETGFYSFKEDSDIQPSFSIKPSEIKEIWTRFTTQANLLVIKIKHKGLKTQIAVPIINFMSTDKNWLYGFYKLISFRKISDKQ